MRIPTTARIAFLSIVLALATNITLLGFIRYQTHDDALSQLRQQVAEGTDILRDVFASGGLPALRSAIDDALDDEPDLIVGLIDQKGRIASGNLSHPPSARVAETGYQTGPIAVRGRPKVATSGYSVVRLDRDHWLLSGRRLDERLALQETLERSLLLALILSAAMGIVGGFAVARYVGSRVSRIAAVVDDVSAGDLSRRAQVTGSGDAFDTLSLRINDMLRQISGLMDELRVLTDSLAHDLRSPIGRLRSRIEQALIEKDEDRREQLLGGVLGEADSVMRMLTTVLEIGRSEAMTGVSQFEDIDPIALIEELAEMYEPLAEDAGVELMTNHSVILVRFKGHRQLLAQALSNLLDNALNYGGGGGTVVLSAIAEGKDLRLTVADRGAGISADDIPEARKRFGRLDASRSLPGAGLGLTLVEAVAHLHKGRLELEDNQPGLRATLILPLD
jgi:signal transduction histidine kinase